MKKILIFFILIKSLTMALDFEILNEERLKNIKYSVDILLEVEEDLPSKEEIENIANRIIVRNHIKEKFYNIAFITFYLPHMKMNAGAYAVVKYSDVDDTYEVDMLLSNLYYNYEEYRDYLAYNKAGELVLKSELQEEDFYEEEEEIIDESKILNVDFSVEVKKEEGLGVKVLVKSNLPAGTELLVEFSSWKFFYEEILVDENGEAETFYLDVKPGKQTLSIITPYWNVQESSFVREVFGKDGKYLRGKYIIEDELGIKTLVYEKEVEI